MASINWRISSWKEGRRAAAPVQLDGLMLAVEVFALQGDFLARYLRVLGAAPVILVMILLQAQW